jgi:hypothetical protein
MEIISFQLWIQKTLGSLCLPLDCQLQERSLQQGVKILSAHYG